MTSGSDSLRVLVVSAFFSGHGGGIEVVAGQLAIRIARRETIRVCWMAGGAPGERPEVGEDLSLTLIQAASHDPLERRLGLPLPLWGIGSLRVLWRETKSADVVHVHDYLYVPSLAVLVFAKLNGVPTLLTQHIGEISYKAQFVRVVLSVLNKSLGRMMLRMADQVVFVAQPVLNYFGQFTSFRRPPMMIPNGVDQDCYRPVELRQDNNSIQLLFVGRFVEKKGVAHLARSFDIQGTCWTFIGDGPLNPEKLWELPSSARVLQGLRGPELVPYYQQADLLVLPSTGEGFPLVLQEALACGTPVLVSTEVAEAFPVLDTRCVFTVETRVADPQSALRSAIADLVNTPGKLTAARGYALELASQWSWDACVNDYSRIIEGLRSSG